jgi:hypothetical protein
MQPLRAITQPEATRFQLQQFLTLHSAEKVATKVVKVENIVKATALNMKMIKR